jgi:hypothetical protein
VDIRQVKRLALVTEIVTECQAIISNTELRNILLDHLSTRGYVTNSIQLVDGLDGLKSDDELNHLYATAVVKKACEGGAVE